MRTHFNVGKANESEFVEEKDKSNSGFWSLKRRKDKSRRGSSVSNTSNVSNASNTENEQSEPIIPVGKTESIGLSSWNGLGTNPQDNNQNEETNAELKKSQEEETVLKNMIESGSVIDPLIEEQNMTSSPRIPLERQRAIVKWSNMYKVDFGLYTNWKTVCIFATQELPSPNLTKLQLDNLWNLTVDEHLVDPKTKILFT